MWNRVCQLEMIVGNARNQLSSGNQLCVVCVGEVSYFRMYSVISLFIYILQLHMNKVENYSKSNYWSILTIRRIITQIIYGFD